MRTITYNKTYQILKSVGCNIETKRKPVSGTRIYITINGNRVELLGQREGERNKRKYFYEDIPTSIENFDVITAGENTHSDLALKRLLARLDEELEKNQKYLIDSLIEDLSKLVNKNKDNIEVSIKYK